jgi:glycosyltransferase involved in cell wall biosynthesis
VSVRVAVLTTSYPRAAGDPAGGFVADLVERVRAGGIEVTVVSPRDFRHFGIAYGHGIVGNLRRRPQLVLLLPVFVVNFARAARRAAQGADLVHAHWLPAALAALATGRPFVVQLWGTDVALARRAPRLARLLLRRARLVVCASRALADDARSLGAGDVAVVPVGIDVPPVARREREPPHVLYAGRLSPEKGVLELVAAAGDDVPLVVVGDGPLRARLPGARPSVPRGELAELYAEAAVVACPSLREGFGMTCLEAMAHGVPVVASDVGGLRDLVVDGTTGVLVPAGDVAALRAALQRLLRDPAERSRLGSAARERARREFAWDGVAARLISAYGDALRATPHSERPNGRWSRSARRSSGTSRSYATRGPSGTC